EPQAQAESASQAQGQAQGQAQAQAQAQEHFKRARELYQSGSYREALGELETAQQLDPGAKDLSFNLGVVNEKLGRIEAALAHFRHYLEMNVTPQERARTEALIRRLEGAKHEVEAPKPTPPPGFVQVVPAPPARAERPPERGRIDAAT